MADEFSTSEDDSHSLFRFSPCTLAKLASLKIASYIWLEKYRKYSSGFAEHADPSFFDIGAVHLEHDSQFSALNEIPRRIGEMIESWIDPISKEIRIWCRNLKPLQQYNRIGSRLDLLIFGGDGRVNLKETISNFLEDESFSNFMKFEMACVFCSPEKIDSLWPSVDDILNFDGMEFDRDFLSYYWISLKRGELNRIPLQGYVEIEPLMIKKCCDWGIRPAIRYFATFFNSRRRFAEIDQFFHPRLNSFFVLLMLPYLGAPAQRYILGKYGILVLKTFFQHPETNRYVIPTWLLIRDQITPQRFHADIVVDFIRSISTTMNAKTARELNHIRGKSFTEIWCNSPYHFREHVLEFHFPEILDEYQLRNASLSFSDRFDRDIRFVLSMLNDADVGARIAFWTQNWSKWIQIVSSAQFEELMNLCLTLPDAVDDFKKTLPDTDEFVDYCDTLMLHSYHSRMDELTNRLYSNQANVVDIKKQIIAKGKVALRSFDYIDKHVAYINRVFSNDHPSVVDDFKAELIFSDDVWEVVCDEIDRNKLTLVEEIAIAFAPPESSRHEEMKNRLLQYFRDRIVSGRLLPFDGASWKRFIGMCLSHDEQRIDEFMKSLPIDIIFETVFVNYVNELISKNTLQQFLMWYFNSETECESFMRKKIRYYKNMRIAAIRRTFGVEKSSVINAINLLAILR